MLTCFLAFVPFISKNSVSAEELVESKTITYAGYGETFIPVKDLHRSGSVSDAYQMHLQKAKSFDDNPLSNLEAAFLALDAGKSSDAVNYLAKSEMIFAKNDSGSKIGGWFSATGDFLGETVTGNEEKHQYSGEGYEKVLMLNLKSIAYLLDGERKAYNVTRRAINWQDVERKRFEKNIQEAKAELEKEKNSLNAKNKSADFNFSSIILQEYAPMEKKAMKLPSAFVNPFAYYVAGMVQEFDSFDDKSLRDNALISYKKALELNPESAVLKEAVNDLQKPKASGTRLVHIVAGDGYVPEKKLLTINKAIPIDTQQGRKYVIAPMKIALYVPNDADVHRIEVSNMSGKKLATLSNVADIEAICLRYQKDSSTVRALRAELAHFRTVMEQTVFQGLQESSNQNSGKDPNAAGFFTMLGAWRDSATHPDMRSWMTLPASMQAARFYIPKDLDKVKLTSYNASGKVVASATVSLDNKDHNFIYARSLNQNLYAYSNKKMWFSK